MPLSYGIYTGGERAFFPGLVAAINALRWYGCRAPFAVFDVGLDPWMQDYLRGFADVQVCDLRPLAQVTRYTDVHMEASPVLCDCGFKAFGIVHVNCFERFTFMDADLLPLCDLEAALDPLIGDGAFVSVEDGWNDWEAWHAENIGVAPGPQPNVNSGLFSLSMAHHAAIMHEWCHLHTRRRAMDRLFADQGALNVVLDKYGVPKLALERELWSQAGLNQSMAAAGEVGRHGDELVHLPSGRRLGAWHTAGCAKLWQQAGVDFTGRSPDEIEAIRRQSEGTSPLPVVEVFDHFLRLDCFQAPVTAAYAAACAGEPGGGG